MKQGRKYLSGSESSIAHPGQGDSSRKDTNLTEDDDIKKTLGLEQTGIGWKKWPWISGFIFILLVASASIYWFWIRQTNTVQYKTEMVKRGNLIIKVTATGNLEPVNTVEIGSELSGLIKTVNVDVNDRVKTGQVLAVLDTKRLEAEVLQSRAAQASARASLTQASATLNEQRQLMERAEKLYAQSYISKQDYENYQASLKRATAAEENARAQVQTTEAALNVAETSLGKARIISPFDGIVLTRNIEPGQAVAASFQTPVLFTLAQDLTHMQLNVDIDEADVGQVREGQNATFTVDAYPNRTFPARLTKLYFASQKVEGVVTYKGILDVDNKDMVLRPGMTATADIVTNSISNALMVPNSALRFTPPGISESNIPKGKIVWTLRDEKPVPLSLKTGLTDEIYTEVIADDIREGTPVIIDIASGKSTQTSSGSGRSIHP